MHVFRNLRHVPAVSSLVKHDPDLVERSGDRFAVAKIAFNKLGFRIDPGGFAAAVSVRFKIIQDTHLPTLTDEKIGNVRSDQTCATGDERAFSIPGHDA